MRKVLSLVLAIAMIVCVMAGCSSSTGSSSTDTTAAATTGTTSATSSSGTIKIGALYPLTGSMADSGKTMQYGIEYAIQQINDAGGIDGKQLEVVYGDTQGDSAVAMTEAERLITEEDVDCLMGCYQSGVTATAAQVAEQYGVPLVSANATSDALTSNGYQYFFRLAPTNMMFIRDMVSFAREYSDKNSLDLKTISICADNSEVGQQTVEWTKYYAEQYGFTVSTTVSYTQGAADLTSEVLQLKDANADVLIADQYVSDAILLTKTMSEQSYSPKMMICKGNGYTESSYATAIGTGADGICVATEFIEGSKGQEISNGFKQYSGQAMNGHSAEAFTVVHVIAEACKNILDSGEEITHDSIQAALASIDIKDTFSDGTQIIMPYNEIQFCEDTKVGDIDYLHTNLAGALTIAQFQNGTLASVYPDDAATSEVQYPATYK